jgi:peptidyl-prolyl cis-trans isomerase C
VSVAVALPAGWPALPAIPLPWGGAWRLATARLAVVLALGGVLVACRQSPPLSADVAAKIDGQEVPYSRFEEYLRRQVGETAGSLDSQVLSGLFDQFLREELLTRLAIEEGQVPPAASHRQAVEALLGEAAGGLSPAEVQRWYDGHRARFLLPERLRLRHILVARREEALDARRRIDAGEEFAAVAQAVSLDPSAPVGGDQGELALDDLPGGLAPHVARLEPGETSEPIEASDGWHLFQLVERLPERQQSLAEVAPEIEARLRQERGDEVLERRLREAADRYNVVVYGQNLPFEYRGEHGRKSPAAAGDPS